MQFTNINIFSILIFVLVLIIVIYVFFLHYKRQNLLNLNFKKLSVQKYFYVKYLFLILSFFILIISIFWPRWEISIVNWNEWIDIVFVLDVSKSMNVADISKDDTYTRLDFAKESIWNFVINNKNNKYGLVIFSWDAVSSLPLTNDLDIFLSVLNNVDYRNLTNQWTNFTKAFELAFDRLNYNNNKSSAIVLLSDWWEKEDLWSLKKFKNDKKIEIYIAWIWSEKWWKIIIWKDVFGRISYQTYLWDFVVSSLNSSNLEYISDIFSWKYIKIDNYSDINKFSSYMKNIEKKVIENNLNIKSDLSREITKISFIFFVLYLIIYFMENKLYKLTNKKW